MTPTIFPSLCRKFKEFSAVSKLSSSSVPKPSSKKSESMAIFWLSNSDKPKAKVRPTMKLLPHKSLLTEYTCPLDTNQ